VLALAAASKTSAACCCACAVASAAAAAINILCSLAAWRVAGVSEVAEAACFLPLRAALRAEFRPEGPARALSGEGEDDGGSSAMIFSIRLLIYSIVCSTLTTEGTADTTTVVMAIAAATTHSTGQHNTLCKRAVAPDAMLARCLSH
jgi:hypothetical protein